MVKRMKEIAENEQEAKNLNSELQQLEEIQRSSRRSCLGRIRSRYAQKTRTHTHTCAEHSTQQQQQP